MVGKVKNRTAQWDKGIKAFYIDFRNQGNILTALYIHIYRNAHIYIHIYIVSGNSRYFLMLISAAKAHSALGLGLC